MTWTAAIMDDSNLDPNSLVARIINADKVQQDAVDYALKFMDEYDDDFKALAAIEKAEREATVEPLPLCMWQILAPVLDDYICEALRASDDPGAEQEPEYPACRQEVSGVIEALRDWLLPEETEPDKPWADEGRARPTWHRWSECQRLRAILTEQAAIARGER